MTSGGSMTSGRQASLRRLSDALCLGGARERKARQVVDKPRFDVSQLPRASKALAGLVNEKKLLNMTRRDLILT